MYLVSEYLLTTCVMSQEITAVSHLPFYLINDIKFLHLYNDKFLC